MLLRKIMAFVGLFCALQALWGEVLEFKYKKDDMYKMITVVDEDVYLNGQYTVHAQFLNKISVTVQDVEGKSGTLKGVFRTSKKVNDNAHVYMGEDEVNTTVFKRDERGKCFISDDDLMPLMRDIPLFPSTEVKIGSSWSDQAIEVHDLRDQGIRKPALAPVNVRYEYIRDQEKDGKDCAVLDLTYAVYYIYDGPKNPNVDYVVKITGGASQLHYWDKESGRPYYYEDDFDIYYFMKSGDIYEFIGHSEGRVTEAKKWDKEKATTEIKKALDDNKIKDTTVRQDEDGVVISLENIQFKPESDILMPEEQAKLKKIAEILKRFPERDLYIMGHTALAGSEAGRQELSEKRAASVAEYLLLLGVRKPDQVTYKGFGAKVPLADNKTEEGRQKNRRVEIKILEN
jgi:outer membrane protein OmpA-like peptidoglycan-associated protein